MPTKYSIKPNLCNHFFHIYNRGTDKKLIFKHENDYIYFLRILNKYLSKTIFVLDKITGEIIEVDNQKYLGNKIQVFAYCLMPNHFHLLIKQLEQSSMTRLMRGLIVSYAMYFNKKYDISGRLFQGVYKARLIKNDEDLISTIEYIHANPINISEIEEYQWSSYKQQIKKKKGETFFRVRPLKIIKH